MEDKAVKVLTIQVIVLSIFIGCALFYLPSFASYAEAKIEEAKLIRQAIKAREEMSALELLTYNTQLVTKTEDIRPEELRLYLPGDTTKEDVVVDFSPIEKKIELIVPGARESDLNLHPIVGSSEHIADMSVWEEKDGLHVVFWTDTVVEPRLTATADYCYVRFLKPRELYDYVIVVDAGHGGGKPGAIEKGYKEKDINLEIVLKMKNILDEMEGVKVYYTRLTDVHVDLEDRAALATDSEANLFISIHQNSISRKASTTKGVQVLYDGNAAESPTNSYAFAKLCKEEMIAMTGCDDRGLVFNRDIYIVNESHVPVALVECGFMTHAEELDNLISTEYQEKIAQALCNAIKRAIEGGF